MNFRIPENNYFRILMSGSVIYMLDTFYDFHKGNASSFSISFQFICCASMLLLLGCRRDQEERPHLDQQHRGFTR